MNINETIRMVSVAIALMLFTVMPSIAYNADTPYTVTLNYIVPSDTSFTVSLAGAETTVDFNPATKNSTMVEPDSQNAAGLVPMAKITNTGNLNQNFSVNLTTAQVAWAVVKVSNFSDYATPITLSDTAQNPTGWTVIATSNEVWGYMYANFTNAPQGTTAKTLQINSQAS